MKEIKITVPENVNEDTYKFICDGFRKKYGNDLLFSRINDNSIIGGFTADIDGKIYDLSIISQLKGLNKHILG